MDNDNRMVDLFKENEEERIVNLSLRPVTLDDFVGQKNVISNLKIAIEAAKNAKSLLEHILLSGPPGLGKTSLAYCIAKAMGAKMTSTSVPGDRTGR